MSGGCGSVGDGGAGGAARVCVPVAPHAAEYFCEPCIKSLHLELLEATTSVSLTFKVFKTDHCWGNFLVHICFSVLDIVFVPHL